MKKAEIKMSHPQAARVAGGLRAALKFIDENISEKTRKAKAGTIKRAARSLKPSADISEQVGALVWSVDFIMANCDGMPAAPAVADALAVLNELGLLTAEVVPSGRA
jgi:hypothetical protein